MRCGAESVRTLSRDPALRSGLAALKVATAEAGSKPRLLREALSAEVDRSTTNLFLSYLGTVTGKEDQRGLEKGLRESVLQVLKARFKRIDPQIVSRIEDADVRKLTTLVARAATVRRAAELFA